jgi:hypothetical protein
LWSEGTERAVETRIPVSSVTAERLTTITLPSSLSEPRTLTGSIRARDLVIDTTSVGTAPRLAVTMVRNADLPDALANLRRRSGVSSVQTCVDKDFDQSLVVSLLTGPESAI